MCPRILSLTRSTAFARRVFTAENDRPGAPPNSILSYSLSAEIFGRSDNLGKTINLNADGCRSDRCDAARIPVPDTILMSGSRCSRSEPGLAPAAGRFLPYVVGRVKPSVTPAAAQTKWKRLPARLGHFHIFNKTTSVKSFRFEKPIAANPVFPSRPLAAVGVRC